LRKVFARCVRYMPMWIQGRHSQPKRLQRSACARPLASIGSPRQRALSMGPLSPRMPYLFWKLARPANSITDGLSYLWRKVGAGALHRHGFLQCSRAYGGALSSRLVRAESRGLAAEKASATAPQTARRSPPGGLALRGALSQLEFNTSATRGRPGGGRGLHSTPVALPNVRVWPDAAAPTFHSSVR
jgi:hypothetical protein